MSPETHGTHETPTMPSLSINGTRLSQDGVAEPRPTVLPSPVIHATDLVKGLQSRR